MKKTFYTEWVYVAALTIIAFATAFTEAAGLGLSMVVAPAYILHLVISPILPFVTFGTANYLLEGVLLVFMCLIIRKFNPSYLFSFVTAVIYGYMLDGAIFLVKLLPLPLDVIWVRIALYVLGITLCALGVSLMFHTYIRPEVYELFVKEVAERFSIEISRFKTVYDCVSCAVAVAVSFIAFGLWNLYGVGIGTVIFALADGWLIGRFSKLLEGRFEFKDALPKLKKVMLGEKIPTNKG